MRALSVQQPQAQLLVRGVQLTVGRTWSAKRFERIAIHASTTLPLGEVEYEWLNNPDRAREYASQGWRDMDALRKLPRSAIVGTIVLESCVLWRDVYQEFRRVFFERDPEFGILIHGELCLDIPDYWQRVDEMDNDLGEDWVWRFKRPVEIEPIADVDGKRNLWNLPEDLAAAVSAAEQRTRKGTWGTKKLAKSVQKKLWNEWLDGYHERWREWARHNIVDHTGEGHIPKKPVFASQWAEARFQKLLKNFLKERFERRARSGGDGVRLTGEARKVMGGRKWMRADKFEAELRRMFYEETDAEMFRRPIFDVEVADPRDRIVEMMKKHGLPVDYPDDIP